MRLRVFTLVSSCVALGAVWACALNPQPFPPDGYDASMDVGVTSSPDAGSGVDASTSDGGIPLGGDDAATDASTDATLDAGDASDAAEDTRDDADDSATDATDAGDE